MNAETMFSESMSVTVTGNNEAEVAAKRTESLTHHELNGWILNTEDTVTSTIVRLNFTRPTGIQGRQ